MNWEKKEKKKKCSKKLSALNFHQCSTENGRKKEEQGTEKQNLVAGQWREGNRRRSCCESYLRAHKQSSVQMKNILKSSHFFVRKAVNSGLGQINC